MLLVDPVTLEVKTAKHYSGDFVAEYNTKHFSGKYIVHMEVFYIYLDVGVLFARLHRKSRDKQIKNHT